MDYWPGLEQIGSGSTQLVTWALAVVGGSVATIVSTSYLRPKNRYLRYAYLLYLPGWMFLGLSIYYGDQISRRCMAAKIVPKETIATIAQLVNQDFGRQRLMLEIGLLVFGIWLVAFLISWVFGDWSVSGQNEEDSKCAG